MLKGFDPLENANCRILILGTMPSVESLARQQYYGYKHNAFWQIMGKLLEFEATLPYNEQCKNLPKNGIALWDVLKNCQREGSLDSNIRDEIPNDFASFFKKHPKIHAVFFNGGPAEKLFKKHVFPTIPDYRDKLHFQRLPSTSPANARMNFEQKLEEWRGILEYIYK